MSAKSRIIFERIGFVSSVVALVLGVFNLIFSPEKPGSWLPLVIIMPIVLMASAKRRKGANKKK